MNLKIIAITLMLGASLPLASARAQTASPAATADSGKLTAADLEDLRTEIRSSKKQLIAATLTLSDAEATRFWPVYDQYAAEVAKVREGQTTLIADYVNTYGKYDDKAATDYITRWLDLDAKTTALRAKYVPIVGKVLPGIKAASFFQIDRRISMALDLKVASELPVLELQGQ